MSTATDTRPSEILGKIKTVFGQKGFDGASMQDLARAAEMSAGNFYRYFASKDAIIAAMVKQDLSELADIFGDIHSSDDPRAAFLTALRRELAGHAKDCDGPLWAEIQAAAGRRPEVLKIVDGMERQVVQFLLATFALIGNRPVDEMAGRFEDHARMIIVLFKGVSMQPQPTPELIDIAVETVNRLLDDVVAPQAARRSGAPALA